MRTPVKVLTLRRRVKKRSRLGSARMMPGDQMLARIPVTSHAKKMSRPRSAPTKSREPTYLKTSKRQRGMGRTSSSSSVPLRTMFGTKAAVTTTLMSSRILPPRPVVRSFAG